MTPWLRTLLTALLILASAPLCSCDGILDDVEYEEMLFVRHAGADMPVWVRGAIDSNVIFLVVHGGPGGSGLDYVEDFREHLEPTYAVAYWDQRHAGSSQGAFRKKDFSPEDALALMADDMHHVIRALKARYGEDTEVWAWGHSFGVMLGTQYLRQHGQGELAGWMLSNGTHESAVEYAGRNDYLRRFAGEMDRRGVELSESVWSEDGEITTPAEVVAWVEANDPIETWDQVSTQWRLAEVVSDYVRREYVDFDPPERVTRRERVFTSPRAPLAELINSARTGQLINDSYNETSIQEFYDLSPGMDEITLPTALLWGRYDHIMSPEVAHDYYDTIGTLGRDKILEFYDAGHSPEYDRHRDFCADVIAFIEDHRR